jgi:hypothetical protein
MRKVAVLLVVMSASLWGAIGPTDSFAYPPAVGILGKATNCLACHVSNGPWKDDDTTVIDILDRDTRGSLRRADNSFQLEVTRGQVRTVLTVIGVRGPPGIETPYRNAWLYVDPRTIGSSALSKFAPGWEVNLPMSCRITGDAVEGYEGAHVSVLPMSLRPSDAAQDTEIVLQVMLTRGDSVKGRAKEGMLGSYFERRVALRVID